MFGCISLYVGLWLFGILPLENLASEVLYCLQSKIEWKVTRQNILLPSINRTGVVYSKKCYMQSSNPAGGPLPHIISQ